MLNLLIFPLVSLGLWIVTYENKTTSCFKSLVIYSFKESDLPKLGRIFWGYMISPPLRVFLNRSSKDFKNFESYSIKGICASESIARKAPAGWVDLDANGINFFIWLWMHVLGCRISHLFNMSSFVLQFCTTLLLWSCHANRCLNPCPRTNLKHHHPPLCLHAATGERTERLSTKIPQTFHPVVGRHCWPSRNLGGKKRKRKRFQ